MKSLEKIIFYLLVLSLPFQLRTQIWAQGETFNEWSSAFFYLSDFFVLSLIIIWFWRIGFAKGFKFRMTALVLFLVFVFLSLLKADNLAVGIYSCLKILEFVLLFYYLKHNFKKLFSFRKVAWLFVLGGLFQSYIAAWQFLKQGSVGLKVLGESTIGPYIVGAAKFVVDDDIVVRSYGLLPHPNILAAFMMLALFCLYYLYLSKKEYSIFWNLYYGFLYTILFTGLWFTFSRVIIFTFLAISFLYFIFIYKRYRPQIKFLILIYLVVTIVFFWLMWPLIEARATVTLYEQSFNLRVYYSKVAMYFIGQDPALGLGAGNFVWQFTETIPRLETWMYQPVHNIYLLIFSEIGFFGFVLFLYFLYSNIILKKKNFRQKTLLFLLLGFLFIGFFDHFFWSLQQGSLMLWLVLGILVSKEKPQLK